MSDEIRASPDHRCLFDVASEQHGYFTVPQAHACGFNWRALLHHRKRGRFVHVRRGLYRLRDYPTSPRDEVVAVWLAVGKDTAVVSHESALDLLDLSDVIPNSVHVTVPRGRRGLNPPSGATVHTVSRPLRPDEVMTLDGIRVTRAARTIADAADAAIGPEQIEMAIAQALARGWTTAEELRGQIAERSHLTRDLVERAVADVHASTPTSKERVTT